MALQSPAEYLASSVNLSMKGCIEGEAALCSMLKMGCESAHRYGMEAMLPEESVLCASVASVCPANIEGVQITGSLCLQKRVPVCEAATQLCEAIVDPSQAQMCNQAFREACPQMQRADSKTLPSAHLLLRK